MSDVVWQSIPELSDRDFAGYQRLIYREAGIFLAPTKKALLVGRLSRRLRELGGTSFRDYLKQAEEDPAERTRLIEAVCTHETRFFREPRQFDLLEKQILPQWRKQGSVGGSRRVRVWSAGCSSGEEPFSLAMALRHALPAEAGWEIDILATDLSSRVLERAREAVWPIEKSSEIPRHYLKAYMLRGTGSQEGRMKASPELREMVHFAQVNLSDERLPVAGRFDLVFCRNVLIYFDMQSKARAVNKLLDRLAPHGYFFLGQAESLSGLPRSVRPVIPAVYAMDRLL
ncbi:CheR family methyltransferase [Polyangium aurulentum]|uniref:CheR family methyltransferase n=1 Tax=Polyangium aurulentum TaxID=2567896 RepID=UPI0010ADBF83|nr:protein-glutamate O-methyltransferase CheR [Polyangium aurulentum]UQA56710.1 protein-glutamate O-methyltransferase CheR [Polyangium aurulentum]